MGAQEPPSNQAIAAANEVPYFTNFFMFRRMEKVTFCKGSLAGNWNIPLVYPLTFQDFLPNAGPVMPEKFAVEVFEDFGWRIFDYADTEREALQLLEHGKTRHPEAQWRIVRIAAPNGGG